MRCIALRFALRLGLILTGASTVAGAPADPQTPEDLAKARLEIVRRIYRDTEEQLKNPPAPAVATGSDVFPILEQVAIWSRRWMEAERDSNDGRANRIAALEGHIKRLKTY